MSSSADVLSLGERSTSTPPNLGNLPNTDKSIIVASLGSESVGRSDSVSIDMSGVYKSLTVLGDKVISELDSILEDEGVGPIRDLNPEDYTPEKTADRIVSGVTSLIDAYARQNPDLEDEALLDSFMTEVRKGIQQGYEEAAGILEALGAFEIPGVKEGIEETMRLVEEKLLAFEEAFLAERNGKSGEDSESESSVDVATTGDSATRPQAESLTVAA